MHQSKGIDGTYPIPASNLITNAQLVEIMMIPGMISRIRNTSNIYAEQFIEDPTDSRGLPLYLHFDNGTVDAASFYRGWKSHTRPGVWDFTTAVPTFVEEAYKEPVYPTYQTPGDGSLAGAMGHDPNAQTGGSFTAADRAMLTAIYQNVVPSQAAPTVSGLTASGKRGPL